MSETKLITSLFVITDTENSYDQIGDIEGGCFDSVWLFNHVQNHGIDGLLNMLSSMNYQIQVVNRKVLNEKSESNNQCVVTNN